jgi:ubiquinol-cytochrome c reductase cytochrome c1 subunit
MLRTLSIAAALALGLLAGPALAVGEAHVEDITFSFEGPFGRFDRLQLQRGLQVYTEVCSACHGMQHVPIRSLSEPGGPALPEDQVRAYAAQFDIFDPALDDTRPRTPNDHFPMSSMETAPDLSLMAKARAGFSGPYGLGLNQLFRGIGGPEYMYSLLVGYTGEDKEEAGSVFYGNTAFPGGWIAMPQPLSDGQVEFADGSPNDLHSLSEDVSAFLMWAAEPKMMARKQAGFTAVVFLTVLAVLLYLTNKRIWAGVKGRKTAA